MRFRKTLFGIIQIPFHKKHLITLACALVLSLSASVAASEDIQQTGAEDARDSIKKAGKLTRRGELAEAETILRRLMKLTPQDSKTKLALAYALLKQRKLSESYQLAFEVAKVDPRNSYAFAILGGTLLNSGNFENAKLVFDNSIFLNRKESLAWAGLGMLS